MPSPTKGHWPKGRRRHSEPPDWPAIVRAMDEAFRRRQGRLLAKKIEVHPDTVLRWRKGTDVPAPSKIRPLVDALYALHLYRVKTGRAP